MKIRFVKLLLQIKLMSIVSVRQLLADEWAVPAVSDGSGTGCSSSDRRVNFLKHLSTHINVHNTPYVGCSPFTPHLIHPPLKTAKRSASQEDNPVGFWESQEVLPPLLEEDSVFCEAHIHEGF